VDRAHPLSVEHLAASRGITRLCHLTPFRNLLHLASDDSGLLSVQELAQTGAEYDRQDLQRFDGHPDHISCSIEYPNSWYLRRRKDSATPEQRLFPDWVCLALKRDLLWAPGTRVCVRNAAASSGALVEDVSPASFRSLYASPITGASGRIFRRQATRLRACPTDEQAEVLVHRSVPLSAVEAVIVRTKSDAKRIYGGLRQIDAPADKLRWMIAPDLLTTGALSGKIARGERPVEVAWTPDDA
jgi:hypothetical protein